MVKYRADLSPLIQMKIPEKNIFNAVSIAHTGKTITKYLYSIRKAKGKLIRPIKNKKFATKYNDLIFCLRSKYFIKNRLENIRADDIEIITIGFVRKATLSTDRCIFDFWYISVFGKHTEI